MIIKPKVVLKVRGPRGLQFWCPDIRPLQLFSLFHCFDCRAFLPVVQLTVAQWEIYPNNCNDFLQILYTVHP